MCDGLVFEEFVQSAVLDAGFGIFRKDAVTTDRWFVEIGAKRMQLNPLDDRVVVSPLDAEETTAGGIVLPDAAQEKPQRGKVVALGPGRLLESGDRCEVALSVGDEVLFGKYGGTDIEVDGKEVKILRESDILAKIV
jgi:chaperonin GroES